MPELPPVEQTWTASTSDYVAALDAAIAAAQAFVNANHDALASLAELQAGINALHGTEIRIGVDASAASAAAAAAATRQMETAAAGGAAALRDMESAAAGAAAALAAEAAAEDAAAAAAERLARGGALAAIAAKLGGDADRAAAADAAIAAAASRDLGDADSQLAVKSALAAVAQNVFNQTLGQRGALWMADIDAMHAEANMINSLANLTQHYSSTWTMVATTTDQGSAAATRAAGAFGGWMGVIGRLNAAAIPLFGGAGFLGIMKTVSGMHLLIDSVAELAAVLIPASVALAAFGVAAMPTLQDIYHQMSNIYTVSQATGQAIYPLSGGLARVAQAVQPGVYTLFGEALLVINSRMGTFQTLATGAAQVLDQLGARASAALLSSGMSSFFKNAVADLQGLGTVIGNVFGILGNLLHTMPGYAEYLLQALVGITHALEAFTGSGIVQGIIGVGLAFHGAVLWGGLLATAVLKLGPALWAWIAPAITRLVSLGVAFSAVAAEEGVFAAASAALGAVNPLIWVAAAVAALGGLIIAIATARSATQQWTTSLLQTVAAAPAVNGLTQLMVAQTEVSARLAAAQSTLAHTSATVASVNLHTGMTQQVTNQAYTQAQQTVSALTGTQKILNDQQNLYNYRLGVLGRALGSNSAAMGMLAATGMKMSDFLKYGKSALAQIEAQVLGTAAAYRAMGQTGGMLGADMNVMNVLASDQYNAVTKLNQAWGTWIQTVTGGMASLSQFETALNGMASDSAATSASLSGSFSTIKQNVGGMTYTLQGFGPAAMQSWQQFTSAVNQGNTVIDQMRTYMALGAVSNRQYTSTVQALVAQLLPFTQGNAAALTMVRNLAIQAGIQLPAGLHAAERAIGLSGNAARNQLAKGMEAATVAGGQLSTVAKDLANTLNTDLTGMMSQAQIKASGLRGALDSLATAIQHGGSMANSYNGALVPVISSMLRLHQSVPAITTELQAMGVKITQAEVAAIIAAGHLNTMTGSVHNVTQAVLNSIGALQQYQNWLNTLHGKTIYVNTVFTSTYVGQTNAAGQTTFHHRPGGAHGGLVSATGAIHAASGAVIPGFAPGRDIVPAWLSPGEAVLNPYATRMLGPGFIHMLNTAAERGGGVNPAALQTQGGGGGFGFGGGMPVIENHLYLDGQEIFANQKVHTLRYNTRNSGARTGAVVPGMSPQV